MTPTKWPSPERLEAYPLCFRWHFDLPAPPQRVWPRLVDTSRLNRALGLARLSFEEREGALFGQATIAGIDHRWEELPWSWVHGRAMEAERRYSKGLAERVLVDYRLEPTEEGSRLIAAFGWVPRGALSRLVLSLGTRALRRRLDRVAREIADAPADELPVSFVQPASLPAEGERLLRERLVALRDAGASEELAGQLEALIRGSDDVDVHRLQPRCLAWRWRRVEREILVLFLQAIRVGLLTMTWDVICPHCRGVRVSVGELGEVPKEAHCEACEIAFGTHSRHAIEITFHIHQAIRDVPRMDFCSAQAWAKRHVLVQQVLPPGATREVDAPLAPGRYRLRREGEEAYGFLTIREGAADAPLTWRAGHPPDDERGPQLRLALSNPLPTQETLIIEETNWTDDALRPEHLFGLQEFRDLFTDAFIAGGVQLAVGEQTILFTDLVGSSRLYREEGDPGAFVKVREHFARIRRALTTHEGVLVKTIGDAAMAAFTSPVAAVSAARDIQASFPPGGLRVRICINRGVCIAVGLNARIDYFGSTVNTAAKLEPYADAGQIVMTDEVHAARDVAAFLDSQGGELIPLDHPVGGGPTLKLWRWSPF